MITHPIVAKTSNANPVKKFGRGNWHPRRNVSHIHFQRPWVEAAYIWTVVDPSKKLKGDWTNFNYKILN